jgi:transposase
LRGRSIAAIGIEVSGGYERGVTRTLLAAGMPVRQVNPFKLRQFARASGVLAKSDPLDVRMIASFVAIMPTRPAQRTPAGAAQVAEILAVRRQLSAEKVAAENASRLLEDAMLRRLCRGRIGRLAADIDLLDNVASNTVLAHRDRLLTSMLGPSSFPASLQLDIGRADHLGPFLDAVRNEFP